MCIDFRVMVIKLNNTIFRVEVIETCTSQRVSKECVCVFGCVCGMCSVSGCVV